MRQANRHDGDFGHFPENDNVALAVFVGHDAGQRREEKEWRDEAAGDDGDDSFGVDVGYPGVIDQHVGSVEERDDVTGLIVKGGEELRENQANEAAQI